MRTCSISLWAEARGMKGWMARDVEGIQCDEMLHGHLWTIFHASSLKSVIKPTHCSDRGRERESSNELDGLKKALNSPFCIYINHAH